MMHLPSCIFWPTLTFLFWAHMSFRFCCWSSSSCRCRRSTSSPACEHGCDCMTAGLCTCAASWAARLDCCRRKISALRNVTSFCSSGSDACTLTSLTSTGPSPKRMTRGAAAFLVWRAVLRALPACTGMEDVLTAGWEAVLTMGAEFATMARTTVPTALKVMCPCLVAPTGAPTLAGLAGMLAYGGGWLAVPKEPFLGILGSAAGTRADMGIG
mmetsp:Transcript_12876/g.35351  ORF Transcript_12876/g.35351 Transcript_12876/m.35351 type:complete len:213 (+) Transcript_12876:303-941(+)